MIDWLMKGWDAGVRVVETCKGVQGSKVHFKRPSDSDRAADGLGLLGTSPRCTQRDDVRLMHVVRDDNKGYGDFTATSARKTIDTT